MSATLVCRRNLVAPVICITDKVADPHFSEYFHDESPKKLLPQGVRLIVHEAGHAVSLEKWCRAAVNYKAADPGSRIELGRQGERAPWRPSRSRRTNPRYMKDKHKELAEWLSTQPSW